MDRSTRFSPIIATLALLLLATSTAGAVDLPTATLIAPVGGGSDAVGTAVSSTGDFNGDGYDDVIVGGPEDQFGLIGRAYFYRGGPVPDENWDLLLQQGSNLDRFGASVSSVGDVNGDGFGDFAVGAPGNDAGASNGGRVYVYFGGALLSPTPDITLTGTAFSGALGTSVAAAGDVNGDGYGDIIVGAPGDAGNGHAYVLFGGATPDAVFDLTLSGPGQPCLFGAFVTGNGDVNGDGYSDVLVSAPSFSNSDGTHGWVSLFLGGPGGGDAVADLVWTGKVGEPLGCAAVADVNGDGIGDVAIGIPAASSAGRVSVYLGGVGMDVVEDIAYIGADPGGNFGKTVARAGDVNGDGFRDLIVGAPDDDTGGAQAGRAFVCFGGPYAGGTGDLVFTGAPGAKLGASVASAGDFDGDGLTDFVIGAPGEVNGSKLGRAYVRSVRPVVLQSPDGGEAWIAGALEKVRWSGPAPVDVELSLDGGNTWAIVAGSAGGAPENEITIPAPSTPCEKARIRITYVAQLPTRASSDRSEATFRILAPIKPSRIAVRALWQAAGPASGDQLGLSVSTTGDYNADGYLDLVVGAPYSDPSGKVDAGRVSIYFGGPGADAVPDLTLSGANAGDLFGWAVAFVGDLNGDGYADLEVGAPLADTGGTTNGGGVYTFYAGPAGDAFPDVVALRPGNGDQYGYSIASIGDFDGDGYVDRAESMPTEDFAGTDAGRVQIMFGGPVGGSLVMYGSMAQEQLGWAIASGDVNGDGFSDLILGAPYRTVNGQFGAGAVVVYYGGVNRDVQPDRVISGGEAGASLGSSLATGDFDGDGLADILIGAPGSASNKGAAFIVSGAPTLNASLQFLGDTPGEAFGAATAATDVNGDGFADAFVGAPLAGGGVGRAYLFYGGPGMDGQPDRRLAGSMGSQFGRTLSVVGDVFASGDGTNLAVGAPLDAGTGKAFLYGFPRYQITTPNGGESWPVGALRDVRWAGPELADVWLSTDGGQTYELLRGAAGGQEQNVLSLRVPHAPTKFARVQVTPAGFGIPGSDQTDSLFTIQTSVSLLALLAAPAPSKGVTIAWNTDPGPSDLQGYRLERSRDGASWKTLVPLTTQTAFLDEETTASARYRLFAVNGLGEELLLGETSFRPRAPLAAWPLPYRGGKLSVSFATSGGLGGTAAMAEVGIFDVQGRLIRSLASGRYETGYQDVVWDGRDSRGADVGSGIYFLRSSSAGLRTSVKLVVVR